MMRSDRRRIPEFEEAGEASPSCCGGVAGSAPDGAARSALAFT
jgi:hypothetical protein